MRFGPSAAGPAACIAAYQFTSACFIQLGPSFRPDGGAGPKAPPVAPCGDPEGRPGLEGSLPGSQILLQVRDVICMTILLHCKVWHQRCWGPQSPLVAKADRIDRSFRRSTAHAIDQQRASCVVAKIQDR